MRSTKNIVSVLLLLPGIPCAKRLILFSNKYFHSSLNFGLLIRWRYSSNLFVSPSRTEPAKLPAPLRQVQSKSMFLLPYSTWCALLRLPPFLNIACLPRSRPYSKSSTQSLSYLNWMLSMSSWLLYFPCDQSLVFSHCFSFIPFHLQWIFIHFFGILWYIYTEILGDPYNKGILLHRISIGHTPGRYFQLINPVYLRPAPWIGYARYR